MNPDHLLGALCAAIAAIVGLMVLIAWYIDQIDRQRRQIIDLRAALAWCGGSHDFAPGGCARDGWLRVVDPLLRERNP